MAIISQLPRPQTQPQEQRTRENTERDERSDLQDPDIEGMHCWYCGERLGNEDYSEVLADLDGVLKWVPACFDCYPPAPPTQPVAARLACPICNETLAPPRRHSCGGATQAAHTQIETAELVSNGRRQ